MGNLQSRRSTSIKFNEDDENSNSSVIKQPCTERIYAARIALDICQGASPENSKIVTKAYNASREAVAVARDLMDLISGDKWSEIPTKQLLQNMYPDTSGWPSMEPDCLIDLFLWLKQQRAVVQFVVADGKSTGTLRREIVDLAQSFRSRELPTLIQAVTALLDAMGIPKDKRKGREISVFDETLVNKWVTDYIAASGLHIGPTQMHHLRDITLCHFVTETIRKVHEEISYLYKYLD